MKGIEIFLKKKKTKKRQYGHERYKNLPDGKKQRLVEWQHTYKHRKIKMFHKSIDENSSETD